MIRKATQKDLIRVKKITEVCAEKMIKQNIYQWNKYYPSLHVLEKDIQEENLLVIEIKGTVWGCIMFSEEKDPVYNTIDWLTPDNSNIYVHRLAIHPNKQGQGYGFRLMNFVEKQAANTQIESIRLDTFSQNPRNIKFYSKRGYKKLGDVYFLNQSPFPFHCFEKVLER